ncbi:uncharacterized protein [Ptychodera flava]|uniref:uncharacterized protein n=1 Tax=Ptychodera flava TaxID=63121 RepID=UPI003969FE44
MWLWFAVKFIIALILVMCALVYLNGFQYGFGVIMFIFKLAVKLMEGPGQNYSQLLIGEGAALLLTPFELFYIRLGVPKTLQIFHGICSHFPIMNYIDACSNALFLLVSLSIGCLLGICCGIGMVSGLVVAFCVMKPSLNLLGETQVVSAEAWVNFAVALLCVVMTLLAVVNLSVRKDLISVAIVIVLVTYCFFTPVLPLALGILYFSGIMFGVSVGHYVPALRDFYLARFLLIQHGLGYIVGYLLATSMGWTFQYVSPGANLLEKMCCIIGLTSAPIFLILDGWEFYHRLYRSVPTGKISDAMKHQQRDKEEAPARLNLSDYAGDEIFYDTHPLFIAKCAIYLIVFNLSEAVGNHNILIKQIMFWLQTVKIHSVDPVGKVFLVGTHRDSRNVTGGKTEEIAALLSEKIYSDPTYSTYLAINKDNTPLFAIENSRPLDSDAICLRDKIWYAAKTATSMKENHPIKWLKFLKLKQSFMESGKDSIWTFEELFKEVVKEIPEMNEQDFKALLKVYHNSGDIIHHADDESLTGYIVLDPQVLVESTKLLKVIPERHKRDPAFAQDWLKYEKKGFLSQRLIKHIFSGKMKESDQGVVMKLLCVYGIMACCFQSPDDNLLGTFVVPSTLPRYDMETNPTFWQDDVEDRSFLFDFGAFYPDMVFSRLIAKCISMSDLSAEINTDRDLFRNMARFRLVPFYFKMEMKSCTPEQHLIRVTVCKVPTVNSFQLFQCLYLYLEDIRLRDFPGLRYIGGVQCDLDSHDNFGQNTERVHVLKLVESGSEFPNLGRADEGMKVLFMCKGSQCIVDLSDHGHQQ